MERATVMEITSEDARKAFCVGLPVDVYLAQKEKLERQIRELRKLFSDEKLSIRRTGFGSCIKAEQWTK